ncbi:MAG: bifunctional diaminohydroxyphosphoribosylaminopyrimidine deaminase/5-amino-6-(5-phosphoribosylamino)uracil reductase RibD [Deinococcales bacterium]
MTSADERFMTRALELAEYGRGRVSPNPMVGCVLVRGGAVVGEGWHRRAGEPHAEVEALRAAGDRARGATAYVTLEPCNHQGRTPPCTEALLAAGVRRVVVAALDPNPVTDGAGVKRLREAGVEVEVGLLQDEAEAQNEVFRTVHRERRPFVLYKTAMTLDGKIATRTGQSRWITGERARERVQRWRDAFDAVAVGINTVLLDDPLLTTRLEGGRTPVKVVFDSVARTPVGARLFEPDPAGQPARVVIFVTEKASSGRVEALRQRGADVIVTAQTQGRSDVRSALPHLLERDVTSLLLEGGGTLAWAFFEARAIDRVAWFIGPKLLGGAGASPLGGIGVARMEDALELAELATEDLDGDLLVTGRVRYPEPESRDDEEEG